MLAFSLQIFKLTFALDTFFKRMAWNLLGLTIISYHLNHNTADLDSRSKVPVNCCKLLQGAEIVLSSAKL